MNGFSLIYWWGKCRDWVKPGPNKVPVTSRLVPIVSGYD